MIDFLPTTGLKNLIRLDLKGTFTLRQFPSIFRFEKIRVAELTYFSHCCAFNYKTPENYKNLRKQDITILNVRTTSCPSTTTPPENSGRYDAFTSEHFKEFEDYSHLSIFQSLPKESHSQQSFYPFDPTNITVEKEPGSKPAVVVVTPETTSEKFNPFNHVPINPNVSHSINGTRCGGEIVPLDYSEVICTPQPNAFHPCSDVMGYVFLRVMVWIVSGTALIGNFVVLVVLASQRHKMTVPKFLMCNLSIADLCMGLYLLMVASVDGHTAGEYFNYSMQWQYGAGCSIAGFISMMSSELSVFSLTVITIERWYTIIYAIDLNKRIRLRLAARIMIVGWLFSILVAVLPLFKVGNYAITSMCLPFYIEDTGDKATVAYVACILSVNTLAFAVICACYINMYVTVRNPHTVMQRKDSKVAKRMAVLVFTDFACWAPMALFGLSGAFGHHLLTIDQSKIFIVLFYPINSCANPFLYAIFTKAFRRDFYLLLAKHGMCEKQAMKYHPNASSAQRSVSQINSTHDKTKQCHRDSSASVLTGITSDNHSSLVTYDKDYAVNANGSPQHPARAYSNAIPMIPLNEGMLGEEDGSDYESHDPQHLTAAEKHQSFAARVNVTFDVPVEGLETVPEEADQNDNYDGQYENPLPRYFPAEVLDTNNVGLEHYKEKQFLLPEVIESYHSDEEDVHRCDGNERNRNNCALGLSSHREDNNHVDSDAFRKNSRADSGIQSVNTTPTDKDGMQKSIEHHMVPCSVDHETLI